MPKYVGNKKPIKEIVDGIVEECEKNPQLKERIDVYAEQFMSWYDRKFDNGVSKTGKEMASYIQLGGTTFQELMQGKDASIEQQFVVLSALAASMEMEGKKDTFQIYLPDGKGGVDVTPIVKEEKQAPQKTAAAQAPKKVKLGLWDSFCKLIGYKTENYKAYETQQKQEEMEQQFRKEQADLVKDEYVRDGSLGVRTAEDIMKNVEWSAKNMSDQQKDMCKAAFGKEDPGNWQLKDGSKLSPLAVLTGVLQSKEVGEPGLMDELLQNGVEQAAAKYPEQWKKACEICKDLADNKGTMKDKDLLGHLEPHEKANYDFMKTKEDKLHALDEMGRYHDEYYQVIQAKGQLHKVLKDDRLALSPSEELVKESIYGASLNKQLKKALDDGNYEKAGQLNGKLIKSQVYKSSLQRIMATQMQQKELGKEVTELTTQDMKNLKRLSEVKVEATELTDSKDPLTILKTGAIALDDNTDKYMKMQIILDDKFGLKAADLQTAIRDEEMSVADNIISCYDHEESLRGNGVAAEIDGELVNQRAVDTHDLEQDEMDWDLI